MAMYDVALGMFIITVLATTSWATSPMVTYIFGDSLTDVGNNNFLKYSLAKSNFPWYGVDYDGGQATGRFTNGRTIGDILSIKLGVPPPPPYLSLSENDDAILKGVNYASGGAGILNETGLYFIQRLSMDDQISCFEKTAEKIKNKVGKQTGNRTLKDAIYLIGIGSNDYVNNYLQPFSSDGQQYLHDDFVNLLISTFDKQIRRLYQLGARKMVINNLGPLGCIPSQRVKSKAGECLRRVNQWVVQFNSQTQKLLTSLNRSLPEANLIYWDTYSPVLDLIRNPNKYGFKVANTSCCKVDTSLGGLCLPDAKMCDNRKEYVFWDAFHPTDAANVLIADRLFSNLFTNSTVFAPSSH
ncbi:hypothetical protein ACHQM5_008841 [Ranunculus cassubicifolius]